MPSGSFVRRAQRRPFCYYCVPMPADTPDSSLRNFLPRIPERQRVPRPVGDTATRMESPDEKHEAEGLLVELCKRIDELASLSDRGFFETEAGSSLALDNAAIHPLSVTAASSAAILSAIDHLNTIAIVVRAGTMPWVSLFTLLRSVIETSSVAVYVLQSESRSERILRVLRGQFAEIKDRVNSQKNLGEPDVDAEAEADKDLIRRALAGYPDAGSWEEIAGKNGARSGPDPSITQKFCSPARLYLCEITVRPQLCLACGSSSAASLTPDSTQ
ncbi:hypothetical protein SAMN06295879_3576 [Agreia bicolorata]|uniref:Uncharacterized protein n=2 Tax=Agreia bicolorata TaxID=110935 RepID=A0A1T4YLN7_9MICO|nr:hypothetical protein SAMN06295879_3576 [Agreia bicolorata]